MPAAKPTARQQRAALALVLALLCPAASRQLRALNDTVAASACTKPVVVVFTGELRGDESGWRELLRLLVQPNDADVILDVWSAAPETEAASRAVFQPCVFFSEPYAHEWVAAQAAKQRRFVVVGDNLHVQSPRETPHVVSQFYRMSHSWRFVARHDFTSVIRARTDLRLFQPLSIGPQAPNTVHTNFEWAGVTYDAGMTPPECPKMANDLLAWGDYWGMATYHDVFNSIYHVLAEMQKDPGYREWYLVNNVRAPGTFLHNAESLLAWRLRLGNVKCVHESFGLTVLRKHGNEWSP